jgi:hypothetical protein
MQLMRLHYPNLNAIILDPLYLVFDTYPESVDRFLKTAKAGVIFSDEAEAIAVNMPPAHDSITRTLPYNRKECKKTIRNAFEFGKLVAFEIAVSTLGAWSLEAPGSPCFVNGGRALIADIKVSGRISVVSEKLDSNGP